MYQPFNRDAVITEAYRSPELARAISKMEPVELQDDMRQELFKVLCAMPEPTLEEMYRKGKQHIRYFLVAVLLNMVKSDRSTFYNTFRREREKRLSFTLGLTAGGEIGTVGMDGQGKMRVLDNDDIEDFRLSVGTLRATSLAQAEVFDPNELMVCTEALAQLDPYEADMLRLYVDLGNCVKIAQETGIPERSVRLTIATAKQKAKKYIRTCYQ